MKMNKKTLLIDADSLCFLPEMSFEEARNILDNKISKIKNIVNIFGIEEFKFYLTIGRNFRYDILPTYKANRKDIVKNENVKLLKNYLIEKYNAEFNNNLEADDLVCDMYRLNMEDNMIASIDKDLLYNLSGVHLNLKTLEYININEKEAEDNFYKQMILGDRVDNIPSLLPNVGEVRLKNLLIDTGSTYEYICKDICSKLNINYDNRYRLLYCGNSEEVWICDKYKMIDENSKIIDNYINFSLNGGKLTNNKTKIKKEKVKNNKDYKPSDKAPGKHKDKTWLEVNKVDPGYINWMIGATKDNKLKNMLLTL